MHFSSRCLLRGLTPVLRGCCLSVAALLVFLACGPKDKPPGALDRSGYHVRGTKVYFLPNWTSRASEVQGADIPTFESPLPKGTEADYARDKQFVYWRGNKMPGVDPKTFEILDGSYVRDSRNVYRNAVLICNDAPHFEVVSGNFVKNSHTVYGLYPAIAPVSQDPAHFRELAAQDGYSFCGDLATVYVNGNPIPGADPATFRVLHGGYTRDAQQTFYFDKPMPEGTQMETLQILTGGYAKDSRRAYHMGKVVEGADPATFVVTDEKFQKANDASHRYEQGKLVPASTDKPSQGQ